MSSGPGTTEERPRIFHVSSSETLRKLRDDILRIHGFEVESTLSYTSVPEAVSRAAYDLVLIDVDGENRVKQAVELCDDIKHVLPHQHVAYVCNYRVAIDSDCPDEIIRAEFDPEALVRSARQILEDR
jgi:DNA-binding NtrC family response regulator